MLGWMHGVNTLKVPLLAVVGTGPNWALRPDATVDSPLTASPPV